MTMETRPGSRPPQPHWWSVATRPDVLSGLMFIVIAAIGLAVSWNYAIGTAVRMGTGYVPRLMCWVMLGLGLVVLVMGVRAPEAVANEETDNPPLQWRPLLLIPASLVVFALGIDTLGFVISGLLMVAVAGLAFRESRVIEVIASAALLTFCTWAIFVWALGLTIPVWPEM